MHRLRPEKKEKSMTNTMKTHPIMAEAAAKVEEAARKGATVDIATINAARVGYPNGSDKRETVLVMGGALADIAELILDAQGCLLKAAASVEDAQEHTRDEEAVILGAAHFIFGLATSLVTASEYEGVSKDMGKTLRSAADGITNVLTALIDNVAAQDKEAAQNVRLWVLRLAAQKMKAGDHMGEPTVTRMDADGADAVVPEHVTKH